MKGRLALAILALAVSVAAAADGFADGREYVYHYRGIVHTKYSEDRPQYAGYAYYVKAIVQSKGDELIFKAENVTKASFNGKFEDVTSAPLLYSRVPEQVENYFRRPFRLTRRNGIVTKLQVTQDEPMVSVNVKRAVASLLSLNLDPATKSTDYYKIHEEDMLGDCESTYVIGSHPHDRVLNITKIRNYHACRRKPNELQHPFHPARHTCTAEQQQHILHGSGRLQYSLRGDKRDYIIDKISTVSDIIYSPDTSEGETITMTIRRSFEFGEERPVTRRIQMPRDLVSHTSLMYEFDLQKDFRDPVDLKKPHDLYHMTGVKVPAPEIQRMLLDLASVQFDRRHGRDIENKNIPAKFVELLRAFSTLSYDEIADLYKIYTIQAGEGESRRYGNLFVDVLGSVGTYPTFLFGKNLIEKRKIPDQEAIYLMQQMPIHLKEVSQVLLDSFQELCNSEYVKKSVDLHVQCVTSLSNLVFHHCVAPHQQQPGTDKLCPYEAALNYYNYIARLHEKTTDDRLKKDYLKAAGMTGVVEALPLLAPYIEGQEIQDLLLRDSAIWALKNVAQRTPEEVRKLLVPIFFNRTEHYILRLDAFSVLLGSDPELYEIEEMARYIQDDQNDQVKSYVYSTFKSLVNSTHPCHGELSKHAQYALRILEDVKQEFEQYDYSYSKRDLFTLYNHHLAHGNFKRFSYLASDVGYIPRKMFLRLEDFGSHMNDFGIGLNQIGMEKFLDRIIGPKSSEKPRGRDSELNDIKTKMNLPVYSYDSVQGEIYFKHLDNHLKSYYFDDSSLERLIATGRSWLQKSTQDIRLPQFSYQRFVVAEDQLHILPTEIGLPLLFENKKPVHLYYKNHDASLSVEGSSEGNLLPDRVKAGINGHLVIDRHLITSMSIDVAYDLVHAGAGISRRSTLSLPLKLDLELATKEKKLRMKWTPVASHEVYHYKHEPFTFIDSYVNLVPHIMEEGYFPVRRVSRHETRHSFLHDTLGVGFNVTTKYENKFRDFEWTWLDYLLDIQTKQPFHYLQVKPRSEPCNVQVQLSNGTQDFTLAVDMDLSYEHYEDAWTIPHFPEENFKDYVNERPKESQGPLYTCVLKANVKTYGNKARKFHTVTTWTRDLLMTFHKMDFYYEKFHTQSNRPEVKKVCASSYLKYPKHDLQKLVTLDTLDLDHEVHSGLKMHFGQNCHSDQKVEVSGLITNTEEQREFEIRREEPDTPEHSNEYSRWYHQCQQEFARGVRYAQGCMKYRELATTLHKYTMRVKHEKLSPAFLNGTYYMDRFLKFVLYPYSDHNEIQVHNPVDEVLIEANFSSKIPVADIRVFKPTSNSNYRNFYLPHYIPFNCRPRLEDWLVKKSLSDLYCGVEGDEVFTFDRFNYSLPPIDCYKVVAKDCSPQEHFTVLATKINHPQYHKAVKVFLGSHKIEAVPERRGIVVSVDGQRVPVAENQPYLLKEGDEVLFYVTFRDSYYALHSRKYGLIVEYDGDAVFVQVSPYYRGKLCGLCGNYNGQKHDGCVAPGGCHYKDEKSYAYAHVVPSDGCTVPRPELWCENAPRGNDLAGIARMGF